MRALSALGMQMRDSLPPKLRDSADYLSIIDVCARETQRLGEHVELARAQFDPASADLLLGGWEQMVRLPIGGRGASVEQRQQKVLWRLRKLLGASEGRSWEEQITQLVGQGWTYEEHVPGDGTSPPADTLRIGLPFPPSADRYIEALTQITEITPAHLEIEFEPLGGFLVDESHLDLEELTN